MSYAVYSTRGFILGSSPYGESGKTYLIYTEDFGLVRARAQGVRLIASKLRYKLEDFSFGEFSLVRGKEFWRLTGTETIPFLPKHSGLRARVLGLMKRLIHGEGKNDELFSVLARMAEADLSGWTEDDVSIFESIALAQALSSLGYLDHALLGINAAGPLDAQAIADARSRKRDIVMAINKALKETQL